MECELWCVERGVRCKMESGKGAEWRAESGEWEVK